MNGGLGTVVALLIALPFVALGDWFKFIKQLPPGQQELAKACHGVGMLALLAYAISLAGGLVEFIAGFVLHPDNFYWIAAVVIAAWGLGWFLLNARYAALSIGQPRATMTIRALLKIAVGWAAWVFASSVDHSIGAGGLLGLLLHIVAVWCVATGGTKLGLMLWGKRRGQAEPMVEEDITSNQFDWDDERIR
jgi:hypothetical protein